ncbi:cyclase family protein [Desulfopila aestuarii]|uniref:Kynurenine formamidase n=1 Tax=Desulfopila aestuarii DSM 18488 TaxID=1121416 RepID=A0A1M7Y8R6_9BACT|nr:cyclase family protein [Desulfopila aestuarii]SHO48971.1 Kynurenine formamidase [Desulfopila aestuarii DSM 18488]
MKIFDLTHPIQSGMPVFPGTESPEILTACTVEEHGFLEKKINMYSHTGTHIDAPAHMLADGFTLDQFSVEKFIGRACIYRHTTRSTRIAIEHLQDLTDQLHAADFLLIGTGWDRYWGQPEYFADFPVLDSATAKWLLQFQLKGIGLDVISADAMDSQEFPVHFTLLGHGLVIIENLTNITMLPDGICSFQCFPLKLRDADGSPVRAVVIVE